MTPPKDQDTPRPEPLDASRCTLVAGGAGFIGAHLCRSLLARGEWVVCMDDLSTGRLANLSDLMSDPRFRFVRRDITRDLIELNVSCGRIYNLACPASPVNYQADRIRTGLTSVIGTLNLLNLAVRDGARLLQASTSEIYGDPEQHPQTEDYRGAVNVNGPRACYDEGKRFAETLACDFTRQLGLETRIARIFNTYGPGMQVDDGRVVSNFIVQALTSERLTIYGDGRQTRSFCYVADTVKGLIALMEAPCVSGPVNIGNPDEITVAQLAAIVLKMTGVSGEPAMASLPEDDPKRRRPDIGRAQAELGWKPQTALAVGLRLTIADFAERLALEGKLGGAPEAALASPRPKPPPSPEPLGAALWG